MAKGKSTQKMILKVLSVTVLLLAMAGLGAVVWWWQNKDNTSNQGGLGGYSAAEEETLPEAAANAQNLSLSGDPEAAQEEISDALLQASGSESKERQQLYIQQGVIYANNGNFASALQSYLEANTIISDSTTTHLIAESYEALGDNQKAIEYYLLAISLLDENTPGYTIDKRDYESRIEALGG